MTSGWLVIGYGNSLRGDDAVGRQIVESVAGWDLPGITALSIHQLTPELAEDISRVDRVCFIDAGLELSLHSISPETDDRLSTHHVTPQSLLTLSGLLYGIEPEGWLLTIPAVSFGHGEPLSPVTGAAIPEALRMLRELLSGK